MREAEGVGGHVAGVGEQGQRAGGDADDHLDHEEGDGEGQRRAQAALVAGSGAGRRAVVVPVSLPSATIVALVLAQRCGSSDAIFSSYCSV